MTSKYLLVVILLLSTGVHASWFESCQLKGRVSGLAVDDGEATFILDVYKAKSTDKHSYVDCKDYIGKSVSITAYDSSSLKNGKKITIPWSM